MAAPTYETDLQPVSLAEDTSNWSEMTGRTSGGAATQEDRAYLQGSYCVSQSTGTAVGRTMGLQYDYLSNISWTTGFVFLFWQYWLAPKVIGIWTDGGMRVGVGSSAGNVKLWNALGNDYGRNPYGGWTNTAVDPTYSYDEVIGNPVTGNYRIFCSAPYLLSSYSKGNPHCVDAIRYGRGQIRIWYGSEADGYGTFSGAATANDDDLARWGLFSLQLGSYLWKGLISLGGSTVSVDFRDANRVIVIDDTPRTYASFNRIEIRNASSRVDWTAISIKPLGTLAPGELEVVDNADVNFDSCTFTDMGTFVFLGNSTILSTIFRRCALVTQNGAAFNGCTFDKPSGAVGLLSDDLNNIDNTDFISDGSGHAIELTTAHAGTSKTLTNVTFSGYALSDGSSGDEAIKNNSGGAVTITIDGGTVPTIYNVGASTTSIVTTARTIKVAAQKADGTIVTGARVLLRVSASASGGFPYDVTVTIVNSGTTATVTHASHGMATTDKVQIKGASHAQNNGVFSITKINDNSYSYTMSSAPGSDPTGTIKCTYVFLEGTTDGNGEIYMSREIGANQQVIGWARKAADLLKPGPISGSVVTTGNSTFTAILSEDA